VAQYLSDKILDESLIYSKTAVLVGEAPILATANGRWCFLNALALLPRVVGNLRVVLPKDPSLRAEVLAKCSRAWCRGRITTVEEDDPERFTATAAVLNVGTGVRDPQTWTTINSNGWLARVSSERTLRGDTQQANPMAALMATAFGVTEVFKRIFNLPAES